MSTILAALPRVGRLVEVGAWAAVVGMGAVVATQLRPSGSRIAAVAQSVTPYFVALAVPIGAASLVLGRWPLAVVAVAVAVTVTVLAWPLLRPAPEPAALAGSTPVRVFHTNLLFENTDTDGIIGAAEGVDADLLAFTEFTMVHSVALLESPLAEKFPHRIHLPGARASGSALWSRYPLQQVHPSPLDKERLLVRVDAPAPFLLYVVHTTSPVIDAGDLRDEMSRLAASSFADAEPTLMVGDFNAGHWHPAFRRLLGAGWRDAHAALGHGFSGSWPDDRRPVPPFVRLDHALLNGGLVAQAIEDVRIPGSDHVAFTVTVAPAA